MKKIIIPFLLLLSLSYLPSQAQEAKVTDTTKQKVTLNEKQLKTLEGIFQSVNDKERYVQFSVRDAGLIGHPLWTNAELHFLPESEFVFTSKEAEDDGPIHLTFSKDSTGEINLLNGNRIGLWKRVRDYKPVVNTEMQHTPDQLKRYEGLYRFQRDESRFIKFTVKDNNLVLRQIWDGNEIAFLPKSEGAFFSNQEPAFSLDFSKDQSGHVTSVTAFKRDLWLKTDKPSLSPAQLKAIEGKFQGKDDPDNQIRISVKDKGLLIKQLWDGKEFVVQPWTALFFYNETDSYPLQILKDKSGNVSQVVLLQTNIFNKITD